jgi:hypothetical protein
MNYYWYLVLSIFIVLISVVDGLLNCLYPPTMETELNPIALFILSLNSVQFLLILKFIGTLFAFMSLQILYFFYKRSTIVVTSLFVLQLCVLLYIIS